MSLARELWHGPLPDPEKPSGDLGQGIIDEPNYPLVLEQLNALSLHGLLTRETLQLALDAWPWSIDIAWIAAREPYGSDAALDELERRVTRQKRRFATLAWAAWQRGDISRARHAVADLDPASPTYTNDLATQAELAILCDATPAKIEGAPAVRLSLLQTWRTEGAAGLQRRFALESAGFPATPSLWTWLIDVWIIERDYRRANAALRGLIDRCGEDHPEVIASSIRLSLDQENAGVARVKLAASTKSDAPWEWTQRQHTQHLRCLLIEAAQSDCPDYSIAQNHAVAANRLYPTNPALTGLLLTTLELTESWDEIPERLISYNLDPLSTAAIYGRLGLPEKALQQVTRSQASYPPASCQARRIRAADLHHHCGHIAKAEAALGPAPHALPDAADHAYWLSELAIANRDIARADGIVSAALRHSPTRMGLILNAARIAFFQGQFATALQHLLHFKTLKAAQLGATPPDDLRDLIVQDAFYAQHGKRDTSQSPGLAAHALALNPPVFVSTDNAPPIPARLSHYWEGPRSAPVERGIRQWATTHPEFEQTVFGPAEAVQWLSQHTPDLVSLFEQLSQPATRADLFRIAVMSVAGGVFADLDEYPRRPVTPWLTNAQAVLVIEEGHGTVANNFLAAHPGLPMFTRLLSRISTRLRETPDPYPWWDCGPAQVTLEALSAARDTSASRGLRFLSQADYERRVSTNLPFPHKRNTSHWR